MMPEKKNQQDEDTLQEVTLPVSDTVPGPGTFHARVLHLNDGETPVVVGIERDSWIGAGTALDVASSLKAPVPGKEPPVREDIE